MTANIPTIANAPEDGLNRILRPTPLIPGLVISLEDRTLQHTAHLIIQPVTISHGPLPRLTIVGLPHVQTTTVGGEMDLTIPDLVQDPDLDPVHVPAPAPVHDLAPGPAEVGAMRPILHHAPQALHDTRPNHIITPHLLCTIGLGMHQHDPLRNRIVNKALAATITRRGTWTLIAKVHKWDLQWKRMIRCVKYNGHWL